MKKSKDIKEMTVEELSKELLDLRKEQFNLRLKKANGALENTHLASRVRKSIARVKTHMTIKAGNSHDK